MGIILLIHPPGRGASLFENMKINGPRTLGFSSDASWPFPKASANKATWCFESATVIPL